MRVIYSNWLRTKRTNVRYISLFCPIIYAVLLGIYNVMSGTFKGELFESFFSIFGVLSCFSMSFFVPMVYEPDKKAGFYANELRSSAGRKKNFAGKFFFIALLYLFIEFMAVFIFSFIILLFKNTEFNVLFIVIMFLLGYFTMLPMILIYQVVNLKYSYSGSILLGCLTVLASILLGTTGLGAGLWKILPFTWNIRINYLMVKSMISLRGVLFYILISLIITVILFIMCLLWYNKWEAKVKMED